MMENNIQQSVKDIVHDQDVRREVTKSSHLLFFSVYFPQYITYDFAPFHREMFALTEDPTVKTLVVTAARGVGKSTILNMSLILWSILGKPQNKFVVILSQTQAKAKQHYMNLRKELEENDLLRSDLGPFKEDANEWGPSLVIPNHNARIMFASVEQSLRGFRHKQHRPDLIIADDLEDNDSVRTHESRQKTMDWLTKDIIPAGSENMRLIVIGTLLHEDSLMMRLKNDILGGKRSGVYKEYPLVDKNGEIQWKARFPDWAAIEAERMRVGDEKAWQQEYLLNIISDSERVIHPEWIQYYDNTPEQNPQQQFRGVHIGVDLAISEKERADYTTMVSVSVYGWGKDMRIYVLPNPINIRKDFPAIQDIAKALINANIGADGRRAKMYAEDNHFQKAFTQMMIKDGYPVDGVTSIGDKRTRLTVINPLVKSGMVLFPKEGCEDLLRQLVGFGIERHDDLSDAFSLVVGQVNALNRNNDPMDMLSKYNIVDESDPSRPFTAGLLDMEF